MALSKHVPCLLGRTAGCLRAGDLATCRSATGDRDAIGQQTALSRLFALVVAVGVLRPSRSFSPQQSQHSSAEPLWNRFRLHVPCLCVLLPGRGHCACRRQRDTRPDTWPIADIRFSLVHRFSRMAAPTNSPVPGETLVYQAQCCARLFFRRFPCLVFRNSRLQCMRQLT